MKTVTLYGRPGCHLCDEARAALLRIQAEPPVPARARSTSRPTTRCFKRYLERIPVVALEGEELFDLFVDEEALRRKL